MRPVAWAGILPLVALALACDDGAADRGLVQPSPRMAQVGSHGPVIASITGSGHQVTQPPALNPGLWRTFTMTARKYADGSVEGSYTRVVHLADGGVQKSEGSITCLAIVGNKAWIGGMIPGNNPPDVAWQMVDNGEGAGAAPDLVGLQLEAQVFGFPGGFAQQFCDEKPTSLDFGSFGGVLPLSILLKPLEAGNIQIRQEP